MNAGHGTRGGFEALDPCVHCGFCLPACPTYLATGDESDSPRGRILLMRALERGEVLPGDPALVQHLDACLGCRGCEPVCPSGVGYGRGLSAARLLLGQSNRLPFRARAALALFRRGWLWRPLLTAARWVRATGLPERWAGGSAVGFALGMVAATSDRGTPLPASGSRNTPGLRLPPAGSRGTVALFRGCVMDTLFGHVHRATRRTLEVNGYRVVEVAGQVCCGALHEHAGDRRGAVAVARQNLAAFAYHGGFTADHIVVNSAGCGALLKDYGHLLDSTDGAALAGKVRDVTELLAAAGPLPGAPMDLDVCYDAPCHLQHAQGVHQAPLAVLGAIPELRLRVLPGSERCCGSAGIYGALHPEMSRAVLDDKIASIREAAPPPDLVASGNPGCLMQIGAGLKAAGLPIRVAHPVELLDWSYTRSEACGARREDERK